MNHSDLNKAAPSLADDNFAFITAAAKEVWTVYKNIEKAMRFMLPTNVAQALVILVANVAGFTATQILWINMVTSVALGLVISFEPHELDVMQRAPRATVAFWMASAYGASSSSVWGCLR